MLYTSEQKCTSRVDGFKRKVRKVKKYLRYILTKLCKKLDKFLGSKVIDEIFLSILFYTAASTLTFDQSISQQLGEVILIAKAREYSCTRILYVVAVRSRNGN